MFYIYLIYNKINGKLYAGKSNNPIYRFRKHKEISARGKENCRAGLFSAIHAAIAKYGHENFIMKIVDAIPSEDAVFLLEREWIAALKSLGYLLYNLTIGGEGSSGFHHSEKTRKKMSETRKGKPLSEKNRKALIGIRKSPEAKRNLSIAKRGSGSKLDEKSVRQIKIWLKEKTYNQIQISKIMKVDRSTISNIARGKYWAYVTVD